MSRKNYLQENQGRSMVEMLGTLAIIGILSTLGIAGYKLAINKYRANEIIDTANTYAVAISTQKQQGLNIDVSAFDFSQKVSESQFVNIISATKTFSLVLDSVNEETCPQMLALAGTRGIVSVSDNCKKLTYYNDLHSGLTANFSYDENVGAKECENDSDCDSGCQKCQDSKCVGLCQSEGQYCASSETDEENTNFTCSLVQQESCTSSTDCAGGCCKIESGKSSGTCVSFEKKNGTAVCNTDGVSCTSNVDCDLKTEYCNVVGKNCKTPSAGTCTPRGTVNSKKIEETDFIYSSQAMSWWAADNWCKANKKHLVALSELGISGVATDGTCEDNNCTSAQNWTEMQSKLGTAQYWTSNSSTACLAFDVNVGNKNVGRDSRHDVDVNLALCK